jgi:anthranilate 1,2-dioxygenase small subunit
MKKNELHLSVERFLFDYAACLNEKRYEEFPAFFKEDDCYYEVQSKENEDLGLTVPIMGCYSHGMIRDRVAQLVDNTLTYRRLNLRHFISNIRIDDGKPEINVNANFQVMQSDLEGVSKLYLVGRYKDKLILDQNQLKLVSKRAILDSFSVPNMLAVPV